MQGAGKGPPAQEIAGLRALLEKLGERQSDVLVDLAVLLGGKPRRNPDIADEQLAGLAPHGEPRKLGAAREEQLQLLLDLVHHLMLDSHGSNVFPRGFRRLRAPRPVRSNRPRDTYRRPPATGFRGGNAQALRFFAVPVKILSLECPSIPSLSAVRPPSLRASSPTFARRSSSAATGRASFSARRRTWRRGMA